MIRLHSRKPDLVLQEIFAAFTIFNFTRAAAWNVDEGWGRSKYERRVNFSHAVYFCCGALRRKAGEIAGLLERTLQPRRPNRFNPRPKISGNRVSSNFSRTTAATGAYLPCSSPRMVFARQRGNSLTRFIWEFLVN